LYFNKVGQFYEVVGDNAFKLAEATGREVSKRTLANGYTADVLDVTESDIRDFADRQGYDIEFGENDGVRLTRKAENTIDSDFTADNTKAVTNIGSDEELKSIITKNLTPKAAEVIESRFHDGIDGFVQEVKSKYNEYGGIADARGLFADGGKGVTEYLRSVEDADSGEVRFSFDEDSGSEKTTFIKHLKEHSAIFNSKQYVFKVNSDSIIKDGNFTETINKYFESIGGKAVNPQLGVVELKKSGAKTTVFHGISGDKLTAVAAIKDVVEKGIILSHDENWKGRGYDTYLIAGKGYINNEPGIVGVIVKNYPNSNQNNKFYLHEVIKIGASHTAVDNNAIRVNEPAPINNHIISQDNKIVNSNSMRNNQKEYVRGGNNNGERSLYSDANVGRKAGTSAGEVNGRMAERSGEATGRAGQGADVRAVYAKNVRANGNTGTQTIKADRGLVRIELINPAAYNDEMLSLIQEAKEKGVQLHFFIGNGERGRFAGKVSRMVRGFIKGSDVYVQYDNEKYTPKQIAEHEYVHKDYNGAKAQKAVNYIRNSLSVAEKNKIIQEYYEKYYDIADGNEEYIFEEFVADVLSGMSEYSVQFENVVNEYWNENSVSEGYNAAEYTKSMDGGGEASYSIENVPGTDKVYVKASRQVINGDNPSEWKKQVFNYINNTIRSGKDVSVLAADGDILTITKDTAGKATFRNNVIQKDGTHRKMTNEEFATKLRAETHIDEVSKVSKKSGWAEDTKNHRFAKDGFDYRTAYFEDFDGQYYRLTLSVGKNGEINTVYNIGKMKETTNPTRGSKAAENNSGTVGRGFLSDNIILQNPPIVNKAK